MSESVLRLHVRWVRGALWARELTGELTALARSLCFQDRAWFDWVQEVHGLRRGYNDLTNAFRHGTTGRRLESRLVWLTSRVTQCGLPADPV